MANSYFKISMHAIGVSGAATFMILLALASHEPMGVQIAFTTIVAGVVCTSRFIASDHTPYEIYWGIVIGILSQVVADYVIV